MYIKKEEEETKYMKKINDKMKNFISYMWKTKKDKMD